MCIVKIVYIIKVEFYGYVILMINGRIFYILIVFVKDFVINNFVLIDWWKVWKEFFFGKIIV